MKLIIVSLYDKATEAYMRPLFFQSEGQATRELQDQLKNPENPIAKHPEDYSMFRIGTFTDFNGEIHPEEPKCIARCHELQAAAQLENNIEKLEARSRA